MDGEIEAAMQGLRGFMFDHIYTNSAAKQEDRKAQELLRRLYEYYMEPVSYTHLMGVALMTKADFGISSISSVPYAVHQMLPVLSLGTWTYIFQTLLVVSLMVLTRRFNVNYLFAFVMGVFFGKMLV